MYDSTNIAVPAQPLKIAVIGCGARSTQVYLPLLKNMKQWVEVTAVCDPVREHADSYASQLGTRAYYDIHQLIRDKPMQAAIVVTPVESHHSLSVSLSNAGIHNLVETTWCSMIWQARDMIKHAADNKVIVRVAENFYRLAIDRFAQSLRESGYIGEIKRVMCYNDHTGYHNNSRWIRFFQSYPESVQCIEHKMTTRSFHSSPERYHTSENYSARFHRFPEGNFIIDHAANIKGFLGRQPRPGHTEWQGETGTLIQWDNHTEIKKATRDDNGWANEVLPVIHELAGNDYWSRTYADVPDGTIEYVNPYRAANTRSGHITTPFYGCVSMGVILHFVLEVTGLGGCEFNDNDALMSLMMEVGARESMLNEGKRIALPLEGELEADHLTRERIRKELGADPYDVEAMLAISYPKP